MSTPFEPHVMPPTPVRGHPSTLRIAVVATINGDGTVDVRAEDSRAGWPRLTVPSWFTPVKGDRVFVADLQGDGQQVAIIAPVGGEALAPVVPRVFTLPTDAEEGDEVYLVVERNVSTGEDILWHLRRGSSAVFPWEFLGGPDLFAEVTTPQTRALATYGNLTTIGPEIRLPLIGEYDVTVEFEGYNNTANAGGCMSYEMRQHDSDWNFTGVVIAALDADRALALSGAANLNMNGVKSRRKLVPSDESSMSGKWSLRAQYRIASAGTATFEKRVMRVTPVRVAAA